MYDYEMLDACYKILKDMFDLQPGESIAITCDSETDMEVVDATAQAAVILGAKPMVIKTAAARDCGKSGDIDMPIDALVAGIKGCDAWLEYNNKWIFYSTAYDRIVEDENNRPRYLCMVSPSRDMILRNVGKVDNVLLTKFMLAMEKVTKDAKHIRVTSPAGMDIEFDNEPGRDFVTADGHVNKNDIKMFPGQISWSPRFETITGTIVVDGTITPPIGAVKSPITFHVEGSVIKDVTGGADAAEMKKWLHSFNDPQMLRVAHLAYGFAPNAKLCGDIVEDERVWGCTEWGFGNVGGILTSDIPGGIPGASHSDGICLNCSVWLDGVQVLDEGVVVGPTPEIVQMARDLGK